ncbi:non-ribosomal peptide synthetase module [Paenibacillus sp. BR2-3]|uniref:non-ribosomal peptide synthetase module n=1 Tax=Paenibacillus sp. BR2-3 TaxID=3048494 RepID=UPI0039779887
MAQRRLATEYVNATMQLTEFQMNQFLLSADTCYISHRVKVLGAGEQEVVLEAAGGEEAHLPFALIGGFYICELSCRVVNPHLNNAIRKLFITYKGTGTVNRIYKGITMVYYYEQGSVRQISEVTASGNKLVYQYKYSAAEMLRLYQSDGIEREIEGLRRKIDILLDMRNRADSESDLREIDCDLEAVTQRLFQLEA